MSPVLKMSPGTHIPGRLTSMSDKLAEILELVGTWIKLIEWGGVSVAFVGRNHTSQIYYNYLKCQTTLS